MRIALHRLRSPDAIVNRRGGLRIVVVALLLSAGYWAAQPWLACVTPPRSLLPAIGPLLGICTFGIGAPSVGAPSYAGYFINVLFGIVYVASAIWVAFTKRPL